MKKMITCVLFFLIVVFSSYGIIDELTSEDDVVDITSIYTALTHSPSETTDMLCQVYIVIGSVGDSLDGSGGLFEITITVEGQTIQPNPQVMNFGPEVLSAIWSSQFPVPAGDEVIVKILSPNVADTTVYIKAYLYDVFPLITSSGVVEADMIKLSGDTVAADNLESMFDGSGYNDDNAPATQLQVSTLAGGVSVSVEATDIVLTEGDQTLTYVVTSSHNGIYHEVASDTTPVASNDIDFYYIFNTGGGMNLPVSFHMHGYYEDNNPPANSTMLIQAYNFNIQDWETMYTLTDSATDINLLLPLHIHDVDPDGGNAGDVQIRFNLTDTEVSQNIKIDHAAVNYVSGGLTVAAIADGVWDESVAGNVSANTFGGALDAVGTDINNRTNNSNLEALLDITDGATTTLITIINSEMDEVLVDIGLDELLANAIDGEELGDVVNSESVIGKIISISNTYDYDNNIHSLEALGDGIVTINTNIGNLKDFDPANDDVAVVTLVNGFATDAINADAVHLDAIYKLIEQMFFYDATYEYNQESGSLVDQIADNSAVCEELIASDMYTDVTTSPWEEVYHEIGNLSNEYYRLALYSQTGMSVTSANIKIGKRIRK